MGALELLWFALIIVFTFIGIVRGYPKELGATTSILMVLLVLTKWGGDIILALDAQMGSLLGGSLLTGPYSNLIQATFYLGLFIATVFISYHGETLAFRGYPPPGPLGIAMNAINGAVNGYLVSGTIWYYLDHFDYPISLLGLFSPPLTNLAKALLPFLPLPILEPYLLLFVAFLILVRVLR